MQSFKKRRQRSFILVLRSLDIANNYMRSKSRSSDITGTCSLKCSVDDKLFDGQILNLSREVYMYERTCILPRM